MKKLIMKLLGLNVLIEATVLLTEKVDALEAENAGLKKTLAELTEKVDEMEIPDFDADDFVREDDINDRVESYLNDNDYCTQSYCDDEIESKVSDAVESAIEDLDIEDKVKEVVSEMDKASFGDTEEIEQAVSKAVTEVLSKAYNALKKGL